MRKLAIIGLVGAVATTVIAQQPSMVPASVSLGRGYLSPDKTPDSAKLLPPPPAQRSSALKRDMKAERRSLALRDTPRWDQAKIDADLFVPNAAGTMSCAAGVAIGPDTTPKLNAILRKAGSDLGLSSYRAKNLYHRERPFMGNGQPTCTPDFEGVLRKDGSYPSGHSAIGYGWSLIIAEVIPSRRSRLLERGRAFGESRSICNVHFRSDIEAGQTLAKAVVTELNKDPVFQADLAAARAEMKTAKALPADCAKERAALRQH